MHDWDFFQTINQKTCVMKEKFLFDKLIRDDVHPIQPWFYSPFKDENDGLLIYKTH